MAVTFSQAELRLFKVGHREMNSCKIYMICTTVYANNLSLKVIFISLCALVIVEPSLSVKIS